MEITPLDTVNLQSIILDTKSIIKANLHFFTLSQFFSALAFSLVTPTLSTYLFTFDNLFHNLKLTNFHLIYILIIYLFTLCGISTISNSTYKFLTGKPVKDDVASLKSLIFSLFPLLSTTILLLLISLTFLFFIGVIVTLLAKNVGFTIDYYDPFLFTSLAKSVGFTIYFHMNWGLASMVVVVESKWGFEALMRSWYLVKGMRSVSLSVFLYFLIANGSLVVVCSNSMNFIFGAYLVMLCLIATTVANALLYFYCKVSHGELEIGEGLFDHDYIINMPADDHEKVPHVTEP